MEVEPVDIAKQLHNYEYTRTGNISHTYIDSG